MLASTQVDVQLYIVAVSRVCASFLLHKYRQTEVVGSLFGSSPFVRLIVNRRISEQSTIQSNWCSAASTEVH